MRKFKFRYTPYERHSDCPTTCFRRTGNTLVEAFSKLPRGIIIVIFGCYHLKAEDDPMAYIIADYAADHYSFDDNSIIQQVDDLDIGGDNQLAIYDCTSGVDVYLGGFAPDDLEGESQEW